MHTHTHTSHRERGRGRCHKMACCDCSLRGRFLIILLIFFCLFRLIKANKYYFIWFYDHMFLAQLAFRNVLFALNLGMHRLCVYVRALL